MDKKSLKNTITTIIAVIITLTLVVFCLLLSDYSLSQNQQTTLTILIIVCSVSILYCFVVGEITQNFSQMDKLWSILPIAYLWIIAIRGGLKIRLVMYAVIVTLWGIRLTINFAKKGAYRLKFWTGNEDYRWSIVRNRFFKNRLAWTAFDLFFISMYQNLLVLAICFPALACMESEASIGAWDIAAVILSLLFLVLETISDNYQWNFQQTKKKMLSEYGSLQELPSPYSLGFNTTGPWGYMRHPNYLGEQGIWISLAIFAIGAGVTSNIFFHWSMVGPLLLVLLFMGSSKLGESISSQKYPLYKDYVDQVHKYIPLHKFDDKDDQ